MADGSWHLLGAATIPWVTLLEPFLVGLGVLFVGWIAKRTYGAFPAWWTKRKQKKRKRQLGKEQKKRQKHSDGLRQLVRSRGEALGLDLPWSRDREWRGPGECIIHVSGERSYFIDAYEHGIGQYERAMRDGITPTQRTFASKAPKPVTCWTDAELEAWLDGNPVN